MLYPFGFGLSYTEFKYETKSFRVSEEGIEAELCVKNIGKFPAKEVVELYVKQPCGALGKSERVLCGL